MATTFCPICAAELSWTPQYPEALCRPCAERARGTNGGHACDVDGIACSATETSLGDVVVEPTSATQYDASPGLSGLIDFWRQGVSSDTAFHAADLNAGIREADVVEWTVEDAARHVWDTSRDRSLHGGIPPVPYAGPLSKAQIFILMPNPRVEFQDYLDATNGSLRRDLEHLNATQQTGLFPYLAHGLSLTGAYRSWRRSLFPLIEHVASTRRVTLQVAATAVRSSLAVIYACAYRSHRRPKPWAFDLPTTLHTRYLIDHDLVPRAQRGEIILFVPTSRAVWDLEHRPQGGVWVRSSGQGNWSLAKREVEAAARYVRLDDA